VFRVKNGGVYTPIFVRCEKKYNSVNVSMVFQNGDLFCDSRALSEINIVRVLVLTTCLCILLDLVLWVKYWNTCFLLSAIFSISIMCSLLRVYYSIMKECSTGTCMLPYSYSDYFQIFALYVNTMALVLLSTGTGFRKNTRSTFSIISIQIISFLSSFVLRNKIVIICYLILGSYSIISRGELVSKLEPKKIYLGMATKTFQILMFLMMIFYSFDLEIARVFSFCIYTFSSTQMIFNFGISLLLSITNVFIGYNIEIFEFTFVSSPLIEKQRE